MAKTLGRALVLACVLVYPVAVYLGITRWSARQLGLVMACGLGAILVSRSKRAPRSELRKVLMPLVPAILLLAAAVIVDDARLILVLPVLVNLALLAPFVYSLGSGRVPMVQRFAELERARKRPGSLLSAQAMAHCRTFTILWSAFLLMNGLVIGMLAFLAPLEWWAWYTGVITYVFMGLLFAAERITRSLIPLTDAEQPPGSR